VRLQDGNEVSEPDERFVFLPLVVGELSLGATSGQRLNTFLKNCSGARSRTNASALVASKQPPTAESTFSTVWIVAFADMDGR